MMRTHSNPASEALIDAAMQHHEAGRLTDAENGYRQALELDPEHPDALHLLGLVHHQKGAHEEAIELIRHAISLTQDAPFMHDNLGAVYLAAGRFDEALKCCRTATLLAPDWARAHFNLGNALSRLKRPQEAIPCYQKALALDSNDADTLMGLGNAHKELGQLEEAAMSYQRTLLSNPLYAEAHFNLGIARAAQGRLQEAADCYEKALLLKSDLFEARYNLAELLHRLGQLEKARREYEQAAALHPLEPGIYAALAEIMADTGRFIDAQTALDHALAIDPHHPTSWALIPKLRKMTEDDGNWRDTALQLLARDNPSIPVEAAIKLQFSLGKYYDDTTQYDQAFSAYKAAHGLRWQADKATPFDRAGFTLLVDTLIANYPESFVCREHQGASRSDRPVLVVGMPRSGTSLIEQIMASHPDAFGAGELDFWWSAAKKFRAATFPLDGNTEALESVATQYEDILKQYCSAPKVVDKMPGNFCWLGFIHTAFPKAKIIHVMRHPIDTCLSIYFQAFTLPHAYADSLEDLNYYYREYLRLMRHWRQVLPPESFLEISYEALVDDQETWSRKIVEFIGLLWSDRCLDFHSTERKVATASNWQVRQKIYRTSKARWRHYEKHLGPLLDLPDGRQD